ncbi:MAG: tRNA-dihydrouridine synthase [Bacteroidetes bacterium]|nr:tRNA-dihydrouridine synthase [Bacteroidota bacterium]
MKKIKPKMPDLFSPFLINTKLIKNRLAVAPMTTQQSMPDGTISKAESDWLERLSEDGYGMVITCASSISDTATAFHNQLSIASDNMIAGLSELTTRMRNHGSVNILQLCHGGSRTIESLTGVKPCSASSYTLPSVTGFVPPLALSQEQIHSIVSDFADACVRASHAGFDGIELHGANGYLFTQFFSRMTNLRDDHYGGSLQNRSRFAREVVKACRHKVPKDFIIGFRMSFENMGMETGLDIDENIQIVNWLAEDGIDYIHTSHLNYAAMTNKYPDKTALRYLRDTITKSLPLVGVGGILNAADAEKAMEYGADIVAIGRAAIGNKNLPAYFKEGKVLPYHTPYSTDLLKESGISENFIDYLKNAPPLASLKIMKP